MTSTRVTRGRWPMSKALTGVAFATLVLASTVPAFAQQVTVTGNRRVDAETIRSYFAGGASPEEARRNMLATGMFSDVRVSRGRGGYVVAVRENNAINRVVFEGNKKIERAMLEPEIQTKARGVYNPATVDADVQRILEIYRRTGRGLATVTPRVVELPNGRIDVVFSIAEGDKTGIKEIRFVGNQAFSSGKLRDLMQSSEMGLLSFIKTNDVYDPDRLLADQEIIRRYYLKNGYADFRFVATDAQFDAARGGWVVVMTVEEGQQYRVGNVDVDSRVPEIDPGALRSRVQTRTGQVYNAEAVERTLTDVTTDVARRGNPFATVRPVGQRDPATGTINIGYVVEDGPRLYVERINIRGNTRTRDYVIRRELDIGEGDAYNKVLLDRGERRLNNLGFFKRVRVSNEPGTGPDRVVVNIDVEDQPTGSFSIAGGYSTADGLIGELSVTESNFLGRGQFVRVAGSGGQRSRGIDFSFTEPYFLGYRLAAGVDLFSKYSDQTEYSRFESRSTGAQLRLGMPVTEEFSVIARYSIYEQNLRIPNTSSRPFNDCTVGIDGGSRTPWPDCELNGEASIALKEARGSTLTSLVGATLSYNALDNFRNPKNGFIVEAKPEIAGVGGDSQFVRITGEARGYYEIFEDVVGIARLQGGHISAFGNDNLRIMDHFFLGPSLVRGFAPSGIGPRDVTNLDEGANALGGTTYFGGSLELQFPFFGLPRDLGLKGAVFADAGTLYDYAGATRFDVNGNNAFEGNPALGCVGPLPGPAPQPECINVRDRNTIRSSVGASILWNSPLGPIRFDYAVPLSKDRFDREQRFRFSGGTRF